MTAACEVSSGCGSGVWSRVISLKHLYPDFQYTQMQLLSSHKQTMEPSSAVCS